MKPDDRTARGKENMRISQKLAGVSILSIGAVLVAVWIFSPLRAALERLLVGTVGRAALVEVPVVMRTKGGLLEVAALNTQETLQKSDNKRLLGIPLGETTSRIDVRATYRYHIELAREWRLRVKGTTATVHAPDIKATIPVSIDTASIRKETKSGWARFDKNENLAALEKGITETLNQKA